MAEGHVPGKNVGDIVLFTLSTCGWCKKMKKLLKELGVEYSYIDVDKLDEDGKFKVEQEIAKWNPACTYPTLVKDHKTCIVGYKPDEIRKAVGK